MPSIFHTYYTLIGKFAAIFRLQPDVSYHAARIVSVEVFILAVFFLSGMLLGPKLALWGAVFALVGNISPPFVFPQAIHVTWYPYGFPWWMTFEALERLYGVPHHIIGPALFIVSLILFVRYFRSKKTINIIMASILLFVSSIIYPPMLFPVVFALPLSFTLFTVRNTVIAKKLTVNRIFFAGIAIIFYAALASYMLLKFQEDQGYPWNMIRTWEINRWNFQEPGFNMQVPLVFGILPLVALPAVIKAIITGEFEWMYISVWAYLPFILLPLVYVLGIPKMRLFETAPFVPFGLLAARSIFTVLPPVRKNLLQIILVCIFLSTSALATVPILKYRIESIDYFLAHKPLNHSHIPLASYHALEFMKEMIPKNSIILSDFTMGNTIPGFIASRSYFGHTFDTIYFEQKQEEVKRFFSMTMTDEDAREFIRKRSIDFVYYGPDEKLLSIKPMQYTFLKKIYGKDGVEIYQVLRYSN